MPRIAGDVLRDEIFIETDYSKQIFYDLINGTSVSQNEKTAWDFALSFSDKRLLLNSSTYTQIAITTEKNWETITSSSSYEFNVDHHSQLSNKVQVPVWKDSLIYLIDRGYDSQGKAKGIKKVMFYTLPNNQVQVFYGSLNGEKKSVVMNLNSDTRFQYFSFENEQVIIAPEDKKWQLLFTQYTHILDEETPYLVTGIITNWNEVQVTSFNDSTFSQIDLSVAKRLSYTNDASTIGYDWKTYSYTQGSFTIHPDQNYLLKVENDFYKLHLIDFYNSAGEKGNFQIEYQKL